MLLFICGGENISEKIIFGSNSAILQPTQTLIKVLICTFGALTAVSHSNFGYFPGFHLKDYNIRAQKTQPPKMQERQAVM